MTDLGRLAREIESMADKLRADADKVYDFSDRNLYDFSDRKLYLSRRTLMFRASSLRRIARRVRSGEYNLSAAVYARLEKPE